MSSPSPRDDDDDALLVLPLTSNTGVGMTSTHSHPSGYPVELFIDNDKVEDFICAICTEVCRNAVETECTHIFCAACLRAAMDVKPECPLDHMALKQSTVRTAGFVNRTVSNLRIRCPHFREGCEVVSVLSEGAKHARTCPFSNVLCESCNMYVLAKELPEHSTSVCPGRQVECPFCGLVVSFDELAIHSSLYCQVAPVPCPNSCGVQPMPRKQLVDHMGQDCPQQLLRCRYSRAGCKHQVPRAEMDAHLQNAKLHLDLVERHYEKELRAVRADADASIRFVLQVGSLDQFLELLQGVNSATPLQHVGTILCGMKLFAMDPHVQERCCFALIKLCEVNNTTADMNIGAIVSSQGIPTIINALHSHKQVLRVQELALHLLRKMATSADVKAYVQTSEIDCIGHILRTMECHSKVAPIQRDAIGVLLNMAVNDAIEQRIGQLGGIRHVLQAMDTFPSSASLVQLACHALFHLTFDENNKQRLFASGALPRLVAALKTHMDHTNTVYYSLRAMAQLAKVDRYRSKLCRLGVVQLSSEAMARHPGHRDLQKKVKLLLSRLTAPVESAASVSPPPPSSSSQSQSKRADGQKSGGRSTSNGRDSALQRQASRSVKHGDGDTIVEDANDGTDTDALGRGDARRDDEDVDDDDDTDDARDRHEDRYYDGDEGDDNE